MAQRKTTDPKRPIETFRHTGQERLNNPPAGLVTPETDRDAGKKTYAYDPHLVWAGKAEDGSFDVATVSLGSESCRALLRAQLDAYYSRLCGLTKGEPRYVLDPQDVYGPDFPEESFRVLKEKGMREYGKYRTKRLVLEAWERLGG